MTRQAWLLLAVAPVLFGQQYTKLADHGDPANRVDLVILGDGYTSAEMAKFAADANAFVNYMFTEEPFQEYQNYFNVIRVDVASQESGSDHPERTPPVYKNTAFDSYYNCGSIARLICVSTTKVQNAIAFLPANQRDMVVVIVNDSAYGGSGGSVAVTSTNASSAEVVMHEIGHSLGLLADEYGGPPPPACSDIVEPSAANATKQTARAQIKWNPWIDATTPIPTALITPALPGLYTGAAYCDSTLFRPTYNSKMRSLNNPYEQINTEQLIKRFYAFVTPIDSVSPLVQDVVVTKADTANFSVSIPIPLTHSLYVSWTIDGVFAGSGTSLAASGAGLTIGLHSISVTVSDETASVRSDPSHVLQEQANWTLTVNDTAMTQAVMVSPFPGGTLTGGEATFTWSAAVGATTYKLDIGTTPGGTDLFTQSVGLTSKTVSGLPVNGMTIYVRLWTVTPGSARYFDYTYTAASTIITGAGLAFHPVQPCRVADTRGPNGPFGGPILNGGSSRMFPIPQSSCGIPSTAQAYALNLTVVPLGPLSFVTIYPSGQVRPLVSTLNSGDGRIKANMVLVPAGFMGGVDVYVTNAAHVILDTTGYFTPTANDSTGLVFNRVTPCRIADTRNANGPLGGPFLGAQQKRTFPVLQACGLNSSAKAYSLNITAVPREPLGYITMWPTGSAQPLVSTLNAPTGAVTANAAIVPAGTNGSIDIFASNDTDLVVDINGVFFDPSYAGYQFYPVNPCRVEDTRNAAGVFGGPSLAAGQQRSWPVAASSCGIPANALALALNATVVPKGPLSYLTLWRTEATVRPVVSTLNSADGTVVANAAIVPTGPNAAVSAFAPETTDLILDISGYFAP